ncbi:Cell division ATP-binding protein FtsE [bioreactor metagenome]|uniref:Cell division ATP-binding protein FtsE n=1 Tax=bioreactor metagenome TaxID=1076179 RepID=A0A644X0I9_9ZZZZ
MNNEMDEISGMPEDQQQPAKEVKNLINVENAVIRHGDNIVIAEVSFSIGAGEFVYFLGRTGSGKSSMMKTLYADLPFEGTSGTVLGYDLANLRRRDIPMLRRKMGMVFQDFQLLTDRSVCENLLFVLQATGWRDREAMDSRIDSVLDTVGLSDKKDKMPHQLSGGEQQKVVIARALLNDPELLLVDEPTGNLDPQSSEEVLNTLVELKKSGKAILMATHDMLVMEKYPSRILWFADGKVTDNKE